MPGVIHQQQVVFHRLAQRREQLALAHPGHLRQQPVRHHPPRHRGGPQQPLRGRADRIHAAQQHIPQRRRQVTRVPAIPDHPGDLLDQVGIPAGPVEHLIRHGRGRFAVEDRRELGRDLAAAESAQLDVVHRPDPLPAGQQRAQRMPPVKLIGTVGDHQQHRHRPQRPDQERGQIQRGRVGPVQILDDEHHRPDRAQPPEQAQHQLQQLPRLQALARRRGSGPGPELGKQPGQPWPSRAQQLAQFAGRRHAGQRPQRIHQRGQRQPFRAQLDALAGQHAEPRRRPQRRQLTDQTGLADPGLPADQRHRGLTALRPPHRRGQQLQLIPAADEDRAHHADTHSQNTATGSAT